MFEVNKEIIFFLKAIMFGFGAIIAIPKEHYKKFLIYGLFLGAGMDIIVILLLAQLGFLKYLNMGAFSIFGLFPFWTPIAWMFAFKIFLYFLPRRPLFFYGYIVMFSVYGIFVGKVLSNYGLYTFNPYVLFFVFLGWFYFAARLYLWLENISLETHKK